MSKQAPLKEHLWDETPHKDPHIQQGTYVNGRGKKLAD